MELTLALRDALHAASVAEDAWPSLSTSLADFLGAEEVTLGGGTGGDLVVVAPRTDPGRIGTYLETYHQQNGIMRRMLRQMPGDVVAIHGFDEFELFRRSDFYNGWCVPQRFNHAFGATMRTLSGWNGALVVNTRREVEHSQMQALQQLMPKLRQALETSQLVTQIRAANRITLSLLEQVGKGGLLLDRRGRIIESNELADAMIESGQLMVRNGVLGSLEASSQAELADLIAQCLAAPQFEGRQIEIAGGGARLILQCTPLPGGLGFPLPQRPAAIVIITDPQAQLRERIATLRAHYGLTRAEADLALAMVQAGSRKGAAQMRSVSDTTARAQLSSIFDKTGVRRQTDLIRLLMSGG